ncbi:UDP-N-acetylglucosamine 1-carboxyvinyltransferase [Candidatus Gottesmanbacteria bacterium]|nr:UDP-N-acetylglucosamine 1-carboxyvinyltransferase [Candidatus Gottesmanbacteria bacterium]
MDKFIISGGNKLQGEIKVSGAKNVAMKVLLAGLLTDEEIIVKNVPHISSVFGTAKMLEHLGVRIHFNSDHTIKIDGSNLKSHKISLELGQLYRTASMVMGPLLVRFGRAVVPNPGGCRIGKRPIDRHIEGLINMGAKIKYQDGYFWAQAEKLHGTNYQFRSNTHTGTETLILAAVLAEGETLLKNAAEEPEIDNLIELLNLMGAKIKRISNRTIVIQGVRKLSGCEFTIMPDRNEVITFGIAALASGGDIIVEGTQEKYLKVFLNKLSDANGLWKQVSDTKTRFFTGTKPICATNVITNPYPGFMTDWQAPWAILMTQATGTSTVHETIYEDRFGYVTELRKMGAKIDFYHPHVTNPKSFYNFNWTDRKKENCQAIKIHGKTLLHNAILEVSDLRAGITLVLAALIAKGDSVIRGIDHIERGYEDIENRLQKLGGKIKRVKDL